MSPALRIPLIRAVLGWPDTRLDCENSRHWLPSYIDAEIGGGTTFDRLLDLTQHLLLCPRCEALYLDLLEVALADDEGRLPDMVSQRPLDLSFLGSEDDDDGA